MKLRHGLAVALLVVLAFVPLFGPRYVVTLLAEVCIFAIVTMSLDVLLGYTGLVSMGHASFFAVAAYTAGLLATRASPLLWVTLPAGVAVAALLAMVVGYFSLRTSAVTFLMITLAFGQMCYALAVKWTKVTGGSDGLAGIPRPTGLGVETDAKVLYWVILGAVVLTFLLLRRILASPFGRVLVGIRENEKRMRALGTYVQRYKLIAFVLAGAVAGVAGVLYAHFVGHVAPTASSWLKSGELTLMVVIGGSGTLVGPMLGAGVLLMLQDLISSETDHWQLILGAIFILFVLFVRGGLVGIWTSLTGRLRKGSDGEKKGVAA